jgi:hypothetical protein
MARKKPFPIWIELMWGPADGTVIETDNVAMDRRGLRGCVVFFERDGHRWESKGPWNGVAQRIVLWHMGLVDSQQGAAGK